MDDMGTPNPDDPTQVGGGSGAETGADDAGSLTGGDNPDVAPAGGTT